MLSKFLIDKLVWVYGKAGNGNGNGKLNWKLLHGCVSGLLDLPMLPPLVRAEAKCAYYLYLSLGQASFLELV